MADQKLNFNLSDSEEVSKGFPTLALGEGGAARGTRR